MAVIVSDTSPIRALHHLGQVAWLHQLFGDVLVPPAVADELANPAPRYASIDVNDYAFLLGRASTLKLRSNGGSIAVAYRIADRPSRVSFQTCT